MRTVDEHGHLSPATRARTILAGRHRVDLAELGASASGPSGPRGSTPAAGLLEGVDAAYLLLSPGVRPPQHRLQLVCRTPVAGLGVLRLEGTAGRAVRLLDLPVLREQFEAQHPTADRGHGTDGLRPCALRALRVSIDTVRVLIPATRRLRAHAVPVDLEAFRAAAADVWTLEGPRTAAHLESHNQQDLRLLVGRRLGGSDVGAVVVRRVTDGHLELGCLDSGGVTALTVAFDARIRYPAGPAGWLRRAARHREVTD